MAINRNLLKKAVEATMVSSGGRGVSIWSRDSARVLRYFERTIPGFKKGVLAGDVLEGMARIAYPEIWAAVCEHILPVDGVQVQCPVCKEWYVLHASQKEKQTHPVLEEIDLEVLKKVDADLDKRANRLISAYNARVSATLRYLFLTETKFTISRAAAGLLETGLAEIYPEFFECDKYDNKKSIHEREYKI